MQWLPWWPLPPVPLVTSRKTPDVLFQSAGRRWHQTGDNSPSSGARSSFLFGCWEKRTWGRFDNGRHSMFEMTDLNMRLNALETQSIWYKTHLCCLMYVDEKKEKIRAEPVKAFDCVVHFTHSCSQESCWIFSLSQGLFLEDNVLHKYLRLHHNTLAHISNWLKEN